MKQSLRVLVVEDSEPDAELLLRELGRAGHAVVCRRVETLEALREALLVEVWDVIISDFSLPTFDGLEALALVRELELELPFIMLSGTMGEETAVTAMRAGVSDYVVKSNLRLVVPAVERALRRAMERRLSREALARRELQLQVLLDQLPAVVWTTDRSLRITSAVGGVFSRGAERMVGRHVQELLQSASPDSPANTSHVLALQGHPEKFELTLFGRSFEAHVQPLRGQEGEVLGVAGVALDITERRRLEAQFYASQRMESIGRLAGGIAHDFNNVLTVIESYSTFVLQQVGDMPQLCEDVETIRDAARRAANLTTQLLAFSRRQVLQPRVLDLNELVARTEKMLRPLLGEDIDLVLSPDAGLEPVLADPAQLEQVLLNLVINARDAMPRGGRLEIGTSNFHLQEELITPEFRMGPGAYVRLAVRDEGIGMEPETRDRVFEPFFTTKAHGKGTGLGLSTAYGIIKQSRGFIEVRSEPGAGSTFVIYLPSTAEVLSERAESRADKARAGHETILLVEDHDEVRNASRRILESGGYRVLVAADPEQALQVAAAHPGPIHLLLTDVVMPVMSGRELGQLMSQRRPEAKVLYMSGYTNNALANQGMLEPDTSFIAKPFSADAILGQVRRVLDAKVGELELA
jgi:two-component system cell cycle sensor histidine kinase/response regulator CckA